MVVTVTERRARQAVYPSPWNTTSTLDGATNAQYFYDYAGQDPINNYDLTGLSCGPGKLGDKLWPDLWFTSACNFHDRCYGGKGKYLDVFRSYCDNEFMHKMDARCDKFSWFNPEKFACYSAASLNYSLVVGPGRWYGGFYRGHVKACEQAGYSASSCKIWMKHTSHM